MREIGRETKGHRGGEREKEGGREELTLLHRNENIIYILHFDEAIVSQNICALYCLHHTHTQSSMFVTVFSSLLHFFRRQIIPLVILEEGSYEKDVLLYVNLGEPQMVGGNCYAINRWPNVLIRWKSRFYYLSIYHL